MRDARTFSFGTSDVPEVVTAAQQAMEGGAVELDDATLRVRLGDPSTFDAEIPRRSIRRARRRPDGATSSRGVHGAFGKWVVNRSGTGLVELEVRPAASAHVRLSAFTGGIKIPAPFRWLLRDRTVRVRRLTISVDEPQAFIDALT